MSSWVCCLLAGLICRWWPWGNRRHESWGWGLAAVIGLIGLTSLAFPEVARLLGGSVLAPPVSAALRTIPTSMQLSWLLVWLLSSAVWDAIRSQSTLMNDAQPDGQRLSAAARRWWTAAGVLLIGQADNLLLLTIGTEVLRQGTRVGSSPAAVMLDRVGSFVSWTALGAWLVANGSLTQPLQIEAAFLISATSDWAVVAVGLTLLSSGLWLLPIAIAGEGTDPSMPLGSSAPAVNDDSTSHADASNREDPRGGLDDPDQAAEEPWATVCWPEHVFALLARLWGSSVLIWTLLPTCVLLASTETISTLLVLCGAGLWLQLCRRHRQQSLDYWVWTGLLQLSVWTWACLGLEALRLATRVHGLGEIGGRDGFGEVDATSARWVMQCGWHGVVAWSGLTLVLIRFGTGTHAPRYCAELTGAGGVHPGPWFAATMSWASLVGLPGLLGGGLHAAAVLACWSQPLARSTETVAAAAVGPWFGLLILLSSAVWVLASLPLAQTVWLESPVSRHWPLVPMASFSAGEEREQSLTVHRPSTWTLRSWWWLSAIWASMLVIGGVWPAVGHVWDASRRPTKLGVERAAAPSAAEQAVGRISQRVVERTEEQLSDPAVGRGSRRSVEHRPERATEGLHLGGSPSTP
jgi:hypothetical protein